MTQDERAEVGETWFQLGQMYGRDLSKASLTLMLNAIDDLSATWVMDALTKWAATSKMNRHPLPAEIREMIHPSPDPRALAVVTVGRIKEAVAKYGWPKPDEARAYIGEDGWRCIDRAGGWQAVCEKPELNIHDTSVTAQMRDSIEADVKLVRAGIDTDRPVLEQAKQATGLEKAAQIMNRLLPKRET